MLKSMIIAALMLSSISIFSKTYSVVTFGSEEGIIFVDGFNTDGAFEIFEALNTPIVYDYGSELKRYVSQDSLLKVTCDASYMCAFIIYPQNGVVLNYDNNAVLLELYGENAERYGDIFVGDFSYDNEELEVVKRDGYISIRFSGQILNPNAPKSFVDLLE